MVQDTESIRIVQNTQNQLKLNAGAGVPRYVKEDIQPVFQINDSISNKTNYKEVINLADGETYTIKNDRKKRFYLTSILGGYIGQGGAFFTTDPAIIEAFSTKYLSSGMVMVYDAVSGNIVVNFNSVFINPIELDPGAMIASYSGINALTILGKVVITGYYADVTNG
jgi:hypothetical protein